MVLVNDEDYVFTLSDGADVYINIYYDDGDSNRPVIGVGHGAGGSRLTSKTTAQGLAQQGFLAFTYDARGQGAGRTGNDSSLGLISWGGRTIIDQFEILDAVIARHAEKVNSEKLGWMGTSQGAIHTWAMMALSEQMPFGELRKWRSKPFPKISAISPMGYGHSPMDVALNRGRGFADPLFGIFSDLSAVTTYEPTALAAFRAAINDGQNAFQTFVRGGSDDYLGLPARMDELVKANLHTACLAFLSWDDNWSPVNETIKLAGTLNGRTFFDGDLSAAENPPKMVVHCGAYGNHRATEVTAETTARDNQQIAFFKSHLLDDDSALAANFGEGSPATWDDVPELQISITPNNDADYILSAGPYADVYSRASGYVNNASFFVDATNSATNSNATRLYFESDNTMTDTAEASASSFTINNAWNADYTLSDYTAAVGSGSVNYTWISARLTEDAEDFTQGWLGASDATLAGIPRVVLYAEAAQAGAVINFEMYFRTGSGATANYVTGGQYRFPDNYTPRTVRRIEIELDGNAMHLDGAAGVDLLFRINNIPHKACPYNGYVGGVPCHPDFTDGNSVTFYVGGSTASYIDLPLHDDSLTTLD